jgi:predicted Zn-dependent protease with MMP-like domain
MPEYNRRWRTWPKTQKTHFYLSSSVSLVTLRTKETLMKLTREEFEEAAASALKGLPAFVQKKMENIAVIVEDRASEDQLREMDLGSPLELLGLYQGIPLDRRGFYYGNVLPDQISLFQNAIESICTTEAEIKEKIREVVIHEVGHYFGLSEERLRELEDGERKRRRK